MASNAGGFRYPVGGDTPDIPRDIKYLADDVNSYALLKTGGTATGAISVPAPTLSGHAANKSYVDAHQRPVVHRLNPTGVSWSTATNIKQWRFDFASPFLSGNWIIQASWSCDVIQTGGVTFSLSTMTYGSDSSYRTTNQLRLGNSNSYGSPYGASLMAIDILPANVGVAIKLDSVSTVGPNYICSGSLYRQTLNVIAWPTLQSSTATWPAAT